MLGERLRDPELVSHALNATGLALVDSGRDGQGPIERALRVAFNAGLQEAAGRAYSSLQEACIRQHRLGEADRATPRGWPAARTASLASSACACWAGGPRPCCWDSGARGGRCSRRPARPGDLPAAVHLREAARMGTEIPG